MNVIVGIICVTIGYVAGLHIGKNIIKNPRHVDKEASKQRIKDI